VRLEELGQLKNPMTSSGIESATFQACSILPQPTTLPLVPYIILIMTIIIIISININFVQRECG
jgi:hypothetical protein